MVCGRQVLIATIPYAVKSLHGRIGFIVFSVEPTGTEQDHHVGCIGGIVVADSRVANHRWFDGDRLWVVSRVLEKRVTTVCHFPVVRVRAAEIKYPQISFGITGVSTIGITIAVGIDHGR